MLLKPPTLPNFRPSLLVTSLPAAIRSILLSMGLDHVLLEFFARAAAGAAVALVIIFFVGLGIPRRSTVTARRTNR